MAFTPGQSGNPSGRSKRDRFLTQHILAELNECNPGEPTKARKLVIALIDKALDGDVPALKEVFDRVEGKVTQPIAGDDELPDLFGGLGQLLGAKLDRIARAGSARSDKDGTE